LSRSAWLTKSSVPDRADFVITLPDDEEWIADFLGAFLLLGERDNWELQGGLSVDEMSAEWFALFMLFATGRQLAIPVGTILEFSGDVAPTGYFLCDGSEFNRADFAGLFGVIGTKFGIGNGTTTANLPDRRKRVAVGKDASVSDYDAIGKTGGEAAHVLAVNELASHGHVQDAHTHVQNSHIHTQEPHSHISPAHNHTQNSHNHTIFGALVGALGSATVAMQGGSSSANQPSDSATATNQSASATINASIPIIDSTTPTNQNATAVNQNSGGGVAHENRPPFLVCNFIIKF